ncbi:hypothetical protein BKA56DRAFT_307288 [Ilyonectria sp. MPI-CAGE-AT-0026]|nr:hypothetical protein BKA56DRAFT_307288 [Ilyonectria sp. MPI-CAGE-AT-0026]
MTAIACGQLHLLEGSCILKRTAVSVLFHETSLARTLTSLRNKPHVVAEWFWRPLRFYP